MRLFVALPLPENILQSLVNLREPVRGIKWQKAEQMHLTLCFLGDTSQDRLPELKSKLNTVEVKPFSIQIDHLGVFPNQRSPRVMWAGLKKSNPLIDLQQSVEKQCRAVGFKAEKRSFKPHITLGRMKKTSPKQVISYLKSDKSRSLSLQTSVNQFNLYCSDLKSEGAVHSVVEEYMLEKRKP